MHFASHTSFSDPPSTRRNPSNEPHVYVSPKCFCDPSRLLRTTPFQRSSVSELTLLRRYGLCQILLHLETRHVLASNSMF